MSVVRETHLYKAGSLTLSVSNPAAGDDQKSELSIAFFRFEDMAVFHRAYNMSEIGQLSTILAESPDNVLELIKSTPRISLTSDGGVSVVFSITIVFKEQVSLNGWSYIKDMGPSKPHSFTTVLKPREAAPMKTKRRSDSVVREDMPPSKKSAPTDVPVATPTPAPTNAADAPTATSA